MATDAFVQCRVSGETKARLRAFATEHQLTESALLKRLLDHLLFRPSERVASASEQSEAPRGERIYVRLSEADRQLLQARAEGRFMAEATYASLLLRAHLRGSTPLPKLELAALSRSVAELSAIRGALQKLAHTCLTTNRTANVTTDNVRLMLQICEGLRDHTKALVDANAASWAGGAKDG